MKNETSRTSVIQLCHLLNIDSKNMATVKINIPEHSPGINLSVILSPDPQQLLEMNNTYCI